MGDDLTIQLFVGVSAIAFLGVALIAGWTHKWFVRSFFVKAAAAAFLAAWFTLLLFGFGVLFFWDLLARTGWFNACKDQGASPKCSNGTSATIKAREEERRG
jgi:hypothetical protein